MKRIVSFILMMALLLTFMPRAAWAEPVVGSSGNKCGDNMDWEYSAGILHIFGTGDMYNYDLTTGASVPWSGVTEEIHTIEVSEGVVSIGSVAFNDCKNLVSVTLPDSLEVIGQYAFSNTTSLTHITFGENLHTIGARAFQNSNIRILSIPEGVTTIGERAFYGSQITEITLPKSVTSIGEDVFFQCYNLKKIAVDSENTAYSSWDNVLYSKDRTTLLCYPFTKTNTHYTVPSGVETVAKNAFYDNDNLKSIVLPGSITTICETAFYDCRSLESITIGSSLQTVEESAFTSCNNISYVYFGGTVEDWANVEIYSGNSTLANSPYIYYSAAYPPDAFTTPTIVKSSTEDAWSFDIAVEEPTPHCDIYIVIYNTLQEIVSIEVAPMNYAERTIVEVPKTDEDVYVKVFIMTPDLCPIISAPELTSLL